MKPVQEKRCACNGGCGIDALVMLNPTASSINTMTPEKERQA